MQTFRRLDAFEARGHGALQAYLRQALRNRILDELRRIQRRPEMEEIDEGLAGSIESPLDRVLEREEATRYRRALAQLSDTEQSLVVGRLELGYSYEQLALVTGRARADAARIAVRRAVLKLATLMSHG